MYSNWNWTKFVLIFAFINLGMWTKWQCQQMWCRKNRIIFKMRKERERERGNHTIHPFFELSPFCISSRVAHKDHCLLICLHLEWFFVCVCALCLFLMKKHPKSVVLLNHVTSCFSLNELYSLYGFVVYCCCYCCWHYLCNARVLYIYSAYAFSWVS